MPFIRLYSNASSLREKRRIAGELISITQRSFDLPVTESHNVSVQFLPAQVSRPEYCAVVEVSGQHLEPQRMARFVNAVAPVLANRFGRGPVSRLLGIRNHCSKLVAVEFNSVGFERKMETRRSVLSGLRAA